MPGRGRAYAAWRRVLEAAGIMGGRTVLRRAANPLLRRLGLRLDALPGRRRTPPHVLVQHRIDLLFDVGANEGQFAALARQHGFTGRIVSFEPLPEAHACLLRNARGDAKWTVHDRVALGAAAGEARINVSANSVSSSILPMLDAHAAAAPQSRYVGSAATPVLPLDAVYDRYRGPGQRAFLKIDTQGFESAVLEGAERSLESLVGVQVELSLAPLYEGQDLYRHFLDFFDSRGFVLWDVCPVFRDGRTGRLLQVDAVFMRPD